MIAAILLVLIYSTPFYHAATLPPSPESLGCQYYMNETRPQVIFDSINIINGSIQIEFNIKITEYCNSCEIMHIDDLISLSIDTYLNILEIRINNIDVFTIPDADVLLPIDDHFHFIYLSNAFSSNNSMDIQNIIEIDDYKRYYGRSIVSTDKPYQLYFGDNSLNASISNICVDTPGSIDTVNDIVTEELSCGDIKYGKLASSQDINYFYFELTHPSDVIFSSCGSSYGTYFNLHYMNNFKNVPVVHEHNCFPGTRKLVRSLSKGQYILEFGADGDIKDTGHDYRSYNLKVTCNINTYILDNDSYDNYYILSEPMLQSIEWFEAERQCAEKYGTTLATITTDDDLLHAFNVIDSTLKSRDNVFVWIGLNGYASNRLSWSWVDGTPCDYTTSGYCIDDIHWHSNQPDGKPVANRSLLTRFGAALFVTELNNASNPPQFYDLQFDAEFDGDLLFLCNGVNSKYKVQNCTSDSCWDHEREFNDYVLESDVTEMLNPFVGHWNSTLFVIGKNQIHHTQMPIFDDDYSWHHTTYITDPKIPLSWESAELYAQHESSVFIYGTQFNSEYMYNEAVLIRIDLNTLQAIQEKKVDFPEDSPLITKGIAATKHSVYFAQQTRMKIYSRDTQEFLTTSIFQTYFAAFTEVIRTTTCVVTNDEKFIYIFGISYVGVSYHIIFTIVKYEIATGMIVYHNTSDACLTRDGFLSTVVSGNGDIYIHGCATAAWQTLVFDTTNEQFKNNTVDIHAPKRDSIPFLRASKLVSVEDNVLFIFNENKNGGISSHFTITDPVSINLEETQKTDRVWPSDGFDIKYYINDFTNSTQGNYQLLIHGNGNIDKLITLNTSKDACICNDSDYKCYNCHQHFDLDDYLRIQDNGIDNINITPIYYDPYTQSKALIIPSYIIVPLQRCVVSFTHATLGPCINSSFLLSHNC